MSTVISANQENRRYLVRNEIDTSFPHHFFNKMSITNWKGLHLNSTIHDKMTTINKTLEIIKFYSKSGGDSKKSSRKFAYFRKLLKKRKKNKFITVKPGELSSRLKNKKQDDFLSLIDDYTKNVNSNIEDKSNEKIKSKSKNNSFQQHDFPNLHDKNSKTKTEIEELEKENKETIHPIKNAANLNTNINTVYSNINLKTGSYRKTTMSTREASMMKNSSSDFFVTGNFDMKKKKIFPSSTGTVSISQFNSPRESMGSSPSTKRFLLNSKSNSTINICEAQLKYLDDLAKLLNDPKQTEHDLLNKKNISKQSLNKIPAYSLSPFSHHQTPSQSLKKNKCMLKLGSSFEENILPEKTLLENKKQKSSGMNILSNSTSNWVKNLKTIKSCDNSISDQQPIKNISNGFNSNRLKTSFLGCKSTKKLLEDHSSGKLLMDNIMVLHHEIDKKGVFIQMENNNKTGRKFLSIDSNNIFNSGDQICSLNSTTAIKFKNILQNKYRIEFKKNEVFGIKQNDFNKRKVGFSVDENVQQLKRFYNRNIFKKREIFDKHQVENGGKKYK